MQEELKSLSNELATNAEAIQLTQAQISQATAQFQSDLSRYQDKDRELRDTITKMMEAVLAEGGDPKYEDEYIKLSYRNPSTRTSVDTARMQLEHPDLFEEYKKVTPVKGSVTIKVKQ